MSQDLLEQARDVVQKAMRLGAQGVRTSLGRTRESELEWRNGKLDRLRESTQMALNVTLLVDGRYSQNTTSDFRPAAIDRFLGETVAMTRVLAPDPHRKLPDLERYEDRYTGDLQVFDEKGSGAVTPAERRRQVMALEEAARAAEGADKIISVSCSASDTRSDSAKATSNGMEGVRQSTAFDLSANVSVRDQGDRKPEGWWYAVSRYRDKLPSPGLIGTEATRRALMMVGARPVKSGEYPCLLENRMVGQLLWMGLAAPLSGNAIQQKRSFLADRLGKQVASRIFTVTDDPHVTGGLASRAYDDEGMSTRLLPVFEQGVLRTFYLDTYYASKLGREPTTESASNLVFPAGDKDLPGLLAAMGTGILVTGFSGGNSNPATGDFSIGIRGTWIDKGKPVHPVSEMNLAGNHLQFWTRLSEMGKDIFPYSSVLSPSLLFDKVQFSGT